MSQLLFMGLLFSVVFCRALYLKRQAHVLTPATACATMGGWFFISSVVLYFVMPEKAQASFDALLAHPYLIFIGFMKGVVFWVMNYAGQTIRKTSNSSAGFVGFLCIGLIALINSVFGEDLTFFQWFSVIMLSVTGVYFVMKGHLSTQSPFIQGLFVLMVLMGTLFGVIDHYFLSHAPWYGLLFLTSIGMLTVAFVNQVVQGSPRVVESIFAKKSFKLGVLFSATEMVILSVLVTHLPVTLGWVAIALAGPMVMLTAALFWGEGNWKEQLALGGVAYASILPIILGL